MDNLVGIVAEFLDAAFVPELVIQYHHKPKATLHIIDVRADDISQQFYTWLYYSGETDFMNPLVKKYNIVRGDVVQFQYDYWSIWNGETLQCQFASAYVLDVNPENYLPLDYYNDINNITNGTFKLLILVNLEALDKYMIKVVNDDPDTHTSFIFVHPVDKKTYKVKLFATNGKIIPLSIFAENVELVKK